VLETEILDALREVEARATERLQAYVDEAESELEEVKERRLETVGMCDQLMIELAQERAEVARLKEESKVI
jgi:hypothetical protein